MTHSLEAGCSTVTHTVHFHHVYFSYFLPAVLSSQANTCPRNALHPEYRKWWWYKSCNLLRIDDDQGSPVFRCARARRATSQLRKARVKQASSAKLIVLRV